MCGDQVNMSKDLNLSEYGDEWQILCHYDEEKESVNLEECLALFEIAVKYGWDASWRYKEGV